MFQEQDIPSVTTRHRGAESPSAPSLVVGLGASAGGLDALKEFFEALTNDTAMAFVVVEYLGPSATSLLPAALASLTTLPVHVIVEGQVLSPGHIFVAPPDAVVELEETTFRLKPSDGSRSTRTPIDASFRSLALEFGARAVGIILSGTGSDGALGVQVIANEGGMTLAQAPEDARFDSMPRSAIATGAVDYVLAPREMAEHLHEYASQFQDDEAAVDSRVRHDDIAQSLPEICDLLQQATDHTFKHYKTSTLIRRIQRRMQVLRFDAAGHYVERLRSDAAELLQLFRDLLIGVTSFFRDGDAFEALAQAVVQPLVTQRRAEEIRVWVPGCATGEEAYSLAILFREALDGVDKPPSVQIFATDIDQRALARARQGLFATGIEEHVSPERLERFFIKKGKRYQISKELRELCLFSPHNVIADPPFSRLDLVSCRNLLIYFGPHLQKKLIPLFHYALRPNGYLFLGPSENLSSHKELFNPVDSRHRISQRKQTAINSSAVLSSTSGFRPIRTADFSPGIEPDLHQLMQRILLDEFAPKSVIATEEGQILSASGEMERFLSVTEGTFQNNVIRLARPGLRVGLRAALSEATKTRRRIVHDKVSVRDDSGIQRVRLTVQPMPRMGEESELFLIVFQDLGPLLAREEGPSVALSAEADALVEQLERELSSTREVLEKTIQDLEATNEELKSSNEELLSMNEELQSANEELETSKEEVQASNVALARAHANLSNLLTSTAIATIFLDDDFNVVSFTPAVTSLYNLMPNDVGRPLAHITHRCRAMPALPSPVDLRASSLVHEDEVTTDEGRHYLRRSHAYQTHEGKADGVVLSFIDVTELKEAEAALRRSEVQLQLITDSLPVLISYVDANQTYRFNNLAYERWFGIPRDSMRGRHVREVIGEATYLVAQPRIELALAGTAVGFESELSFKDGSPRTIRAEYVPDISPEGHVRGYFSLKYDITDERRIGRSLAEAKQTAEEASVAKSNFLASMSHEIRTPLTAILGYSELLQTHTHDPDNIACIDAITRNGRHLVELINDILDLSKIEAGMLRTERVRVSPVGLLRDVVDAARVRAAEKGLTLDVDFDTPMPDTIESDPTRLRQILFNLISNAIKFTEAGGVRVIMRVLQDNHLIEVDVIDTGIGIGKEDQTRLFSPFTQADSTIVRRFGGTGLGLAISRHLVEMLGGTISVESDVGRGSTFKFTIATGAIYGLASNESLNRPAPPILMAPRLTGRSVLVVDDRRDMRYLIQTYLEEAGARVEGAKDGADALEVTKSALTRGEPFDAIVLDMHMPNMDGYEAAPRLKALGHSGPLIALTANAMKGEQERCLALGCTEYMTKPVDRLRLLYAVSRAPSSLARERAGNSPSTPAPAPEAPRARVLLVDDSGDSLEVLSALLENASMHVMVAQTGAQALERAAAFHPQVVVLDLGLPDVDGYAVLEHLRQLEDLRATRFIALTGSGGRDEQERMREAGFHHQVIKPPDFKELVSLIAAASLSERSQAQRA
ncbi:MAG: CheR family methyltransferase [Polyangiaceae bacterium]